MKKIAIIGYGVVGKGMEKLLKDRFEIGIYDPAISTNKRDVYNCDLAIICVPTNMKEDGYADTSIVEEVVSWIDAPLILIKSTVPPTTTETLAKKYNKEICFSPEYMGETKFFTPFWKYPDPLDARGHTFMVIGGNKASEVANYFMKVMSVDVVYHLCSSVEAELIKYAENSFFATKVTFCNEFYNISKAFGVDWKGVREGWLLDPRINKNHTLVFEDERGFGGKCFPKDVNAIVKASEDKGYEPTLLKAVLATNKKIRNV
jgi:UDPglucose 6-dehydrogenase